VQQFPLLLPQQKLNGKSPSLSHANSGVKPPYGLFSKGSWRCVRGDIQMYCCDKDIPL
jgi:hypothetical protein